MPVEIQEVVTQVEVTDSESVLSPDVFARIVAAVLAELKRNERDERARARERDLRSIVEQQRDDRRWSGGGW